eukprot:jgi/Ulvmu1/748/UM010_0122.1
MIHFVLTTLIALAAFAAAVPAAAAARPAAVGLPSSGADLESSSFRSRLLQEIVINTDTPGVAIISGQGQPTGSADPAPDTPAEPSTPAIVATPAEPSVPVTPTPPSTPTGGCGSEGAECCPDGGCNSAALTCGFNNRCRTCGNRVQPACTAPDVPPCNPGFRLVSGFCATDIGSGAVVVSPPAPTPGTYGGTPPAAVTPPATTPGTYGGPAVVNPDPPVAPPATPPATTPVTTPAAPLTGECGVGQPCCVSTPAATGGSTVLPFCVSAICDVAGGANTCVPLIDGTCGSGTIALGTFCFTIL